MFFKLIQLIFVTVAVAATIESSIINRLLELDLGLKGAYVLLDRIDEESANITASDVSVAYNAIIAPGTNSIQQPFSSPCDEAIQFTICEAYHMFAITSIELYSDLTDDASKFNNDLRKGMQEGFDRIHKENAFFVEHVAPSEVPLCLESIQWDCFAMNKAYWMACKALTPNAA
ncbi:hypothetical protein ASPVEDRAFT_30998 [Aspergillus versicolor CBS 583.65]|uniref:Uncharacterized protein n=1 Tax=Aspergillus versicolor CBS 583.65 TaxID=1036611 RepID=A0A1L9PSX6_ASPVE|nr:uncharacterized protein ASPVEDRAFT_30998 [Aspergillus versicolor CBS 583.65]OJJ04552.1 hypothetical protein ASPVEDRAFT_30998 [Aspergillus versicolor CBS 583.65]